MSLNIDVNEVNNSINIAKAYVQEQMSKLPKEDRDKLLVIEKKASTSSADELMLMLTSLKSSK